MQTHILGFPRIGGKRELKQALESFWKGDTPVSSLLQSAETLKERHWKIQKDAGLDYVSTGDFSFYDQMLDMTCMLGAIPERFHSLRTSEPEELYFGMARGHARHEVAALEMTKWFDTNYHYLVPEISGKETWSPSQHPVVKDTLRAKELGYSPKPVLVGPFTWLALAKERDVADKWSRLDEVLAAYAYTLASLAPHCNLIQIDEPVLCTDWLARDVLSRFASGYSLLKEATSAPIMLATYFGPLGKNIEYALDAGCSALHVDLARSRTQLDAVLAALPKEMQLSLGLVDGRNIWKNDFEASLMQIEKAVSHCGPENVLLGSSCSLLHCPVDLEEETALPRHIRDRMAFAAQKCSEVAALKSLASDRNESSIREHGDGLLAAASHPDTNRPEVRSRCSAVNPGMLARKSPYAQRAQVQKDLSLPELPTTTIGSFPQTAAIRKARLSFKRGEFAESEYISAIRKEIADCIAKQEELGLDVFVHGEAERNDMVEYFGQQLGGFCFTLNGWVQSYGSRCVKPPVIYGDVFRQKPMTLDWILYAQSLTQKPLKGMLTGPVTILCWSFVRDDLDRSEVCRQIALAIRDEVRDLEQAGIRIIQIDEAALREGMPLTAAEAEKYLRWAVNSFRLASAGVEDKTQIHTHMCYSEFNAILPWIAEMDADVISIESSRSGMELLEAFKTFDYPAEVGPGVYDIHSPRVPSEEEIAALIRKALEHIPREKLWINPDCGLKTRTWDEAYPSLQNMVAAAKRVRNS